MLDKNLTISLVQCDSTVGNLGANRDRIIAEANIAHSTKSDLVVFPELFLCGYQPLDMVKKPAFLKDVEKKINEIAFNFKNKEIKILFGAPLFLNGNVYNTYFCIDRGKISVVGKKSHLPNYDVFDEKRNYSKTKEISLLDLGHISIGFPICEDAWHMDVIFKMKNLGANLIIVPNGSPYESDKINKRHNIIKQRCLESKLPIIYLNLVGGQDELVFDGGSFICNFDGRVSTQFPQFSEASKQIAFVKRGRNWIPKQKIIERLGSTFFQDYNAIVLGLRHYVYKSKFTKVVIGLSGGIDSALVTAIACDALGCENVLCIALPSKYNSSQSKIDASLLCKNLGVTFEVIEIDSLIAQTEASLSNIFLNSSRDTTEENIQSRIRATLLMAISNKKQCLLLTTGNKSEIAVGYSTIYGDMAGAFNPIKDVYKTKVYELAKWRNNRSSTDLGYNIIPENILNKEPTAELSFNQKDSDMLPHYDDLDKILYSLIEEDLSTEQIIDAGYDREVVCSIEKLLYLSEYKRVQAAPGPKISRKPFSLGRRYPIVNHWRDIPVK